VLVLTTKAKKFLFNIPAEFEIIMAKAKRSPISQRRRARVGARIRSCFRYHFLSSVYHAPHTRLHLPTSTSGQLLQYRDSRDSSLSHNCRPSLSEQGRFALCLLCHPFCALLQNLWKRAPKLGIAFELPGRPTSDLREETKSEVQSPE